MNIDKKHYKIKLKGKIHSTFGMSEVYMQKYVFDIHTEEISNILRGFRHLILWYFKMSKKTIKNKNSIGLSLFVGQLPPHLENDHWETIPIGTTGASVKK